MLLLSFTRWWVFALCIEAKCMVSRERSCQVGLEAAVSGGGAVVRVMAMQCLGWPLAAAWDGPGL